MLFFEKGVLKAGFCPKHLGENVVSLALLLPVVGPVLGGDAPPADAVTRDPGGRGIAALD